MGAKTQGEGRETKGGGERRAEGGKGGAREGASEGGSERESTRALMFPCAAKRRRCASSAASSETDSLVDPSPPLRTSKPRRPARDTRQLGGGEAAARLLEIRTFFARLGGRGGGGGTRRPAPAPTRCLTGPVLTDPALRPSTPALLSGPARRPCTPARLSGPALRPLMVTVRCPCKELSRRSSSKCVARAKRPRGALWPLVVSASARSLAPLHRSAFARAVGSLAPSLDFM